MISVVLATHNEAANLPRCLDSVKDWADEIVIADGESSDDTVKIAKRYRATVIQTTNKANFHINKQLAMDKAKGDLILQLDADEVVDDQLRKFIHQLSHDLEAGKAPDQPVAWCISRRNFFISRFLRKGGQYPDKVIRLYRRGRAHLPQRDVHEQMVVDGEVGQAEGHLLHYAYPTFAEYARKFQTYTSFKADQLAEQRLALNPLTAVQYLLLKPLFTFGWIYGRHRGYVDGVPGFIFAAGSGWHHAIAYLKYWDKQRTSRAKKEK